MSDASPPVLRAQVSCQSCSLSRLCLPASLEDDEIAELDNIVRRNRPLHKGDYLFRAEDPMQHVFALRSGALKTYLLDKDGKEQITGFILPGEMLGLDAIGSQRFRGYAMALETSLACAIALPQLEELSGRIPGLRHQLLQILSHGIHSEHQHIGQSRERAEQRLATFLLGLSARYRQRGLSPNNFILPMTRSEIGNYLDLTVETVSRLFTRYVQSGLIECQGREVRLLDRAALCNLGGLHEDEGLRQAIAGP